MTLFRHDDLFLYTVPWSDRFTVEGHLHFFVASVQFLPRLLSRGTTTKDLWKRCPSLSLSLETSPLQKTRPLYRGQRDFESGLESTQEKRISLSSAFFFFSSSSFGRKPDVESIALFCCRAALRFIAINLPDLSLLVENICVRRGSTTIELIAGNGGGDFFSFFFNLATLRFEPIECFNGSIFVASINPSGQFVSLQNILRAS